MATTDKWKHQIQSQINEWKSDYHQFMADRQDNDWTSNFQTAEKRSRDLEDNDYNWDDQTRDQLESWWHDIQSQWHQFKAKNL